MPNRLPTWILPAALAAIVVGVVLSKRQKESVGPSKAPPPIPSGSRPGEIGTGTAQWHLFDESGRHVGGYPTVTALFREMDNQYVPIDRPWELNTSRQAHNQFQVVRSGGAAMTDFPAGSFNFNTYKMWRWNGQDWVLQTTPTQFGPSEYLLPGAASQILISSPVDTYFWLSGSVA